MLYSMEHSTSTTRWPTLSSKCSSTMPTQVSNSNVSSLAGATTSRSSSRCSKPAPGGNSPAMRNSQKLLSCGLHGKSSSILTTWVAAHTLRRQLVGIYWTRVLHLWLMMSARMRWITCRKAIIITKSVWRTRFRMNASKCITVWNKISSWLTKRVCFWIWGTTTTHLVKILSTSYL